MSKYKGGNVTYHLTMFCFKEWTFSSLYAEGEKNIENKFFIHNLEICSEGEKKKEKEACFEAKRCTRNFDKKDSHSYA